MSDVHAAEVNGTAQQEPRLIESGRLTPAGDDLLKAEGFLFIGDPHISSKRPGRRKDKDYTSAILRKLDHAIGIANEKGLIPIVLGDLFDRPKEDDEGLKTKLIRILKKSWIKVVVLVGNHDRRHARLTDGDSLGMLAETDFVCVVSESGPIGEFAIGEDETRIGLGGTPHGQDIPNDVRPLFPQADTVVWLTHHDIAFAGAYPGSNDAFEILGCALVVNGHMHLTKQTIQRGPTTWFNPGNITRQAIDAIDHIPRAWQLSGDGTIEAHDLPHERDVFDLTGTLVAAVSPGEVKAEADEDSLFVDMLQAEAGTEMERTDDGSVLLEEIEQMATRDKTSPEVLAIIRSLHRAVTAGEGSPTATARS